MPQHMTEKTTLTQKILKYNTRTITYIEKPTHTTKTVHNKQHERQRQCNQSLPISTSDMFRKYKQVKQH